MDGTTKEAHLPQRRLKFAFRVWGWITIFVASFSLFMTPYYIAFLRESKALAYLDDTVDTILAMDILVELFVARFVAPKDILNNQWAHVGNYGCMVLDALSILPVNALRLLVDTNNIYFICIIFSIWRFKKVAVFYSKMEENPSYFFWVRIIKLTSVVLLNVHVGGCLLYLIASLNPDPQTSWTKAIENFFQLKLWKRYVTSTYFAMTTYTTIGYGDLHAESPAEMIFSMIYMFWNIGLTAYVLGHFGKLVVENIRTHAADSRVEDSSRTREHKVDLGSPKPKATRVVRKSDGGDPENPVEQLKLKIRALEELGTPIINIKLVSELELELHHGNNLVFEVPLIDLKELCTPKQEALCFTILQVWELYLVRLCTDPHKRDLYGFIDPGVIHGTIDPSESTAFVTQKLLKGNKKCYFAPFVDKGHWQLFIIEPEKQEVVVLCSAGLGPDKNFVEVVKASMEMYNDSKGMRKQEVKWSIPICQRQLSNYECGYYVMIHMFRIVRYGIVDWTMITGDKTAFRDDEMIDVRERCAKLVLEFT